MPQSEGAIKLGRFAVDARIAVGGMATVYRARLTGSGGFERRFALKLIHPHLTREEGFLDRFYDEARIASRVQHPNVVSTVGIESANGHTFLVLELISGVTLRQLALGRSNPFPAPEAARIIADAARGLQAVHSVADEQGASLDAIHRDISPHNLMIDTQGRAVLIDLGLVKARGQLGHTQTGVLAGKLPYMSPEQSLLAPLEVRSDVFSLGSVLYELVVGELPFGDDSDPGTLDRLRACDRSALALHLEDAHVEPWLSSVILACLHQDPNERFDSALALAEAIEDELQNVGATDAELRRWISTHARVAQEALPPSAAVSPEELGVSTSAASPARFAWAAMAVAAIGIAAFFGASAWRSTGPEAATPAPSMSLDAARPAAPEQPAKVVNTASPSASPAAPSLDESEALIEEEALDAEAKPKPRRRSKRKSKPKPKPSDAPALKDNPYTRP